MAERAPYSPVFGTGWLVGWRLTFAGEDKGWDGALATVVEDPGSQVFVMLYEVTPLDEQVLDTWEGTDLGLWRKIRVRVSTLDGEVAGLALRARRRGRAACRPRTTWGSSRTRRRPAGHRRTTWRSCGPESAGPSAPARTEERLAFGGVSDPVPDLFADPPAAAREAAAEHPRAHRGGAPRRGAGARLGVGAGGGRAR